MCGIAGVISKKGKAEISVQEIVKMGQVQKHRGPDDSGLIGIDLAKGKGIRLDENASFLGKSVVTFNRLSIQDLSKYGHQPMTNSNQNVILTFNGEIYNFKELRKELLSKGYQFKSKTDTEVILNLYLEYGIELTLKKLNGMFAIALFDLRTGQAFLCRDRFGIKPLYFASTENFLLFSSEIKSFLEFHEFEPRLNMEVLQEYIMFRNSREGCLLKDVEQILPGEICQISLQDNRIHRWNFFEINSYCREDRSDINAEQVKKELWEVLNEVIDRQMISDVKVGCQLSGGIDSSLVSYIAAENYGMTDTFSVVIDDERFSEEYYIDLVDERLKACNHKLKMHEEYYVNNFVNAVWHLEGIMPHASTLGVYQIAEAAGKEVTVLLSGEGADEVFGGYKCFTDQLNQDISEDTFIIDRIISANGKLDDETARNICPGIQIETQVEKRRNIYRGLTGSFLDKQLKYEIMTYLPEVLIRQDKMSMAHSIENRVPLLDNNMVEYAFKIPERLIMNRKIGQGKDILKQLCIPIFGQEFAYRKKMGFGMPTNRYLFSNCDFAEKVICNLQKRDIFNGKMIQDWSKDVTSLRGVKAELLFKMFGFEIWCELFLDKKKATDIMGAR